MKRRSFLGTLATAFAAPSLAATGRRIAPTDIAGQRELLIQHNPVAGFQYYDGDVVWPRLGEGDALRLEREPDNPYDGKAVAVYWLDAKLGYVPRWANTAIAQMMDRDERLAARVARLCKSEDPWRPVEMSISACLSA